MRAGVAKNRPRGNDEKEKRRRPAVSPQPPAGSCRAVDRASDMAGLLPLAAGPGGSGRLSRLALTIYLTDHINYMAYYYQMFDPKYPCKS